MRVRSFLLGVLIGLALAPVDWRVSWRLLRDRLAGAIDAALRMGVPRPPLPRS
jgi:hypothetical protein